MSLFNLPTADAPLGPKNGGTAAYDKMIVQPVSQPGGANALVSGTAVNFRFRSDSSKYINYRESRLYCRWSVAIGPPQNAAGDAAAGAARSRSTLPPNLRMAACPNSACFGGGAKYTLNGTVVENMPDRYYEVACANLWAKQDGSGETAGSNGLLTRDKRMRVARDNNSSRATGNITLDGGRLPAKQAIIRLAHNKAVQTGAEEFEIEEPIHLASFNGSTQLCGPSDHELEFIVATHAGSDMFFSQDMIVDYDNNAAVVQHHAYRDVKLVGAGGFPAAGAFAAGTVYVCLRHVEAHIAYISPQMATIPASVSNRFSEYFITTRALDSDAPQLQVVVPSSTRQIWIGMRQNHHDVRMDREELSKATGEIDEYGATQATGAGAAATRPLGWTNLQCRLGTASAPVIPFSNLDVRTGKFSRVFNEALSICGKPNGLRATEWSYDDFCGQTSANGAFYPDTADQVLGDIRSTVMGDMGGLVMLRLITPPGSMDNTLFIDGKLRAFNPGAKQEIVIIAVHEQRVAMTYAAPQELPISTVKTAVI